ncbi:uncharacterized protein LAJ45_04216 [Morchella importuna]|uniref:uncharacterized protein n=1 Tax=Morchella importuna TaxID=1174673 RepID=UPI001E8DE5B6|nr:uncharacterized protein LAJ45_04216 [Morchella importuna]KAH8151594.1 hypothetical protein LAJ45_04216 [Morchella importuna]
MSTSNNVRIIARIRPLLKNEIEKDIVVRTEGTAISMPNPKNENENFTFPFNAVHDSESDQSQLFSEVSPTIKHLFKGNDVTIFAYGATGSGKTYTMRGQKSATERGIIPRLLNAIYRRGKELERKSEGEITMTATMSYYEIYNDKVFDLFMAPEKRTPSGLSLRDNAGKTVVVGLTEKEISSLKEFETLYDKANNNRSTSATKLNAHSSRSHAIICVRVAISNRDTGETRTGTVSCIDLAGSEDNRRTCNDKERMIESASINKSLFVLAQCVEAMTKKQNRIPYRESKMTRILSLGQNNGLTVMILNLAPTKAFHMDTLSALNFANRAKKIELKQAETDYTPAATYSNRQPLPALLSKEPTRAFGTAKTNTTQHIPRPSLAEKSLKATRAPLAAKPAKPLHKPASSGITKNRQTDSRMSTHLSSANIADIVEKKVEEILAARALESAKSPPPVSADVSFDFSRRLELLEKKLEKKADARAEGLTYILLAKQHTARGENFSALKMYELAQTYFPDNPKIMKKIAALRGKKNSGMSTAINILSRKEDETSIMDIEGGEIKTSDVKEELYTKETHAPPPPMPVKKAFAVFTDNDRVDAVTNWKEEQDEQDEQDEHVHNNDLMDTDYIPPADVQQTPRTQSLLKIINSEDVAQIMKLRGVGKKRAESLAQHVRGRREAAIDDDEDFGFKDLEELGMIRGIGQGMVENMRNSLVA